MKVECCLRSHVALIIIKGGEDMYIGNYNSSYYNILFKNANSVYSASKSTSANLYSTLFGDSQSSTGTTNLSALSDVKNLKTGAASLSNALSALTGGSAFRKNSAVSSDTNAMTVSASGGFAAGKETSVKIDQIATGQKNEGASLSSSGKAGFDSSNQFSVEVGGKTYQFDIKVAATDTNKDVQQKMADAINKRGIGITASVSTNSDNKTSALSVAANGTGEDAKNSFTIKDISGNAVAKTGAGNITQNAANARYSVNGEAKTSKTNEVSLGNGITATLKKASDKEISVTSGLDAGGAIGKLQKFADSYNQLYNTAIDASNSGNSKLFSQLVNNSKLYSGALSRIGIGFDGDGKMTIDTEKASKALKDGSLETFFTKGSGSNFGFANQLSKISSNVSRNTMAYVDKSSMLDGLGYNKSGAVSSSLFNGSGNISSLFNLLL